MEYIVLKPFTYNGVNYTRGNKIDNSQLNIPLNKIITRIEAGILIESNKLSPEEKARIMMAQSASKQEKASETTDNADKKKVEQPVEESTTQAEPSIEGHTLFNNNNIGGGRGRKNRN